MRAAAFLQAAEALPFASLHELTGGGGLVVVAPHPDDESLGCAGLIAAACAADVPVRLVVVSDGVGSHPNSKLYPPLRLRDLREAETIAAAAVLGLEADAICFLRLPDRHVPIVGADAERSRNEIVAAAAAVSAGAVCVTWPCDPHCDHAASAELVRGARSRLGDARILFYPVWGWTLPADAEVGPVPRGWRFDITAHRREKAAAIAAHRSQTSDLIDDDPDGFRLTGPMIANFARPFEVLLHDTAEDDAR